MKAFSIAIALAASFFVQAVTAQAAPRHGFDAQKFFEEVANRAGQ